MSEVYDFSPTFQAKILALFWRDSISFSIYREVIKPKFFESEIHIDIARMLFKYYEKYQCSPTLDVMLEEVREECNKNTLKEEKKDLYIEELNNLANMNLDDAEYIKDKVIAFGRRQAMTQAILDSVDDVKRGKNYDKVEARIKDATNLGVDLGDLGSDYFENIEQRVMTTYNKEDVEKIPTGISALDKIMKGGLGRKELGIVIAPPGTGKTMTLVNFGASAIMKGKNVLHLTLEMSEERMQMRYDSRLTKKSSDFIKDNQGSVITALELLKKHKKGRLIVKEFPPRTCTPSMIKAFLTKLKIAKNFIPDLIIIDYPDLMKPDHSYGERRQELEILYEDCRAIGVINDCAVWGASQTNRGALAKEVVTIADLAESFAKSAVADFMIALCQTKEEKQMNQLRYFVAKHRNGQDAETICCEIAYEKMYVKYSEELQGAFEVDGGYGDMDGESGKKVLKRRKRENIEEKENTVANNILDKMGEGA